MPVTTYGMASCVFDGATTAGDYVQTSVTTAGDCHDAGSTYPTTNQVVGRVLSTNGAAGTYSVMLFGVEIRAASAAGGGNTLSVGSSASSPLNGGTISGTSVVYFIADGAIVTLPAASTVGQHLILLSTIIPVNVGFLVSAQPGDQIEVNSTGLNQNAVNFGGNSIANVELVSDGLGDWLVLSLN